MPYEPLLLGAGGNGLPICLMGVRRSMSGKNVSAPVQAHFAPVQEANAMIMDFAQDMALLHLLLTN